MKPKYAVACLLEDAYCIRIDSTSLKNAREIRASIHKGYKPTIIEQHQKMTPALLKRLQIPVVELNWVATHKVEQIGLLKSMINVILRRKAKAGSWSIATEKEVKAS